MLGPEAVLLFPSAVVWPGFGVDLSVVVGKVDFVVVVRRRETEAWLVCDLILVEVLDEGLDCLLLGEDAVGKDWESCLVPPATFLWTAVVERGFVDGDSRWDFVFPLLVGFVSLDGETSFVGSGVELLEFRDVRHLTASMSVVIRIEMMAMMTITMSSSCLRFVIVALPLLWL